MAETSIPTIRRSYKFRLYPTKAVEATFHCTLQVCRNLYNCALEQRITAWRSARVSVHKFSQMKELPGIKMDLPEVKIPYSTNLIDVIFRLDRTYTNFFRGVKLGRTSGFPRFKSVKRYKSFTYTSGNGFKISDTHLTLSKIGRIRWKPWTFDLGQIRTVTVKKEADGWYAILSCVIPLPPPLPKTDSSIGIDLGMKNIVATSDGDIVAAPRIFKKHATKLARAQRKLSRRKKGSNRWKKAANLVARQHQRTARVRKAFLDKLSKDLISKHDVIGIEDLDINAILRLGGGGAKGKGHRHSLLDSAWGVFIHMLTYKAEEAGRQVIAVDPAYTSQICSGCGVIVEKDTPKIRIHNCPDCSLILDRDVNAARNILYRALSVLRGEGNPSVKREAQRL